MRKVVAIVVCVPVIFAGIAMIAHFLLGGSTHTRADYARAYLRHLGSKVESYRLETGRFPESLRDLVRADPGFDGKGPYARERELVDPWGREYYYRLQPDPIGFVLFSLGADGTIGGSGEDADLGYKKSRAGG